MILNGESLKLYQDLEKKLQGVTSWREIAQCCSPEAVLFPPAPAEAIRDAEQRLALELPQRLKQFYAETNGVLMNCGAATVMPVQDMIEENMLMRDRTQFADLYMPFDHLLFIGQAGNGDLWAFGIMMNGTVNDQRIFAWNHEDDARPLAAFGLKDLLKRVGLGWLQDASHP